MYRALTIFSLVIFTLLGSCRDKGCTDKLADNYQENANYNDGSCEYSYGCMDTNAVNYDTLAKIDDGSCIFEYVAVDSSFQGFINWTLGDTNFGPDPFNSGAHGSNDSTVAREVYFYKNAQPSAGSYRTGSRIVKYSHSENTGFLQVTAMAKRGNNFDPDHGNWEWFILDVDGSIALDSSGLPLRGSNVLSQYQCASCHNVADVDYIFTTR